MASASDLDEAGFCWFFVEENGSEEVDGEFDDFCTEFHGFS